MATSIHPAILVAAGSVIGGGLVGGGIAAIREDLQPGIDQRGLRNGLLTAAAASVGVAGLGLAALALVPRNAEAGTQLAVALLSSGAIAAGAVSALVTGPAAGAVALVDSLD